MEFKVHKKEQLMAVYWEKNASGVQEANFDIKEDNDRCKIQEE
jgi:hypothetical protein